VSDSAHLPTAPVIGHRGQVATELAQVVDQFPGVSCLDSLTTSTLYPGGRVGGVVLHPDSVVLHLDINQSRFGEDLIVLGEQVRLRAQEVMRGMGEHRTVLVSVDNLSESEGKRRFGLS
jgi:hypothetical protein